MASRRESHDRLGGVPLELGQSPVRGDTEDNDDWSLRLDPLRPGRLPLHGRRQLVQRPARTHHLHQVRRLLLAGRPLHSLPDHRGVFTRRQGRVQRGWSLGRTFQLCPYKVLRLSTISPVGWNKINIGLTESELGGLR